MSRQGSHKRRGGAAWWWPGGERGSAGCGKIATVRVGIAHHLGWAVAVVATDDHRVVERRRVELIEQGLPAAPIHHEGGAHEMHRSGPALSDGELAELVATVRSSVARATAAALDELAEVAEVAGAPIVSLSLRAWSDVPDDIAVLRRAPHESRADSIMYLRALADGARRRGWAVHHYDANRVEADAAALLGPGGREVLHAPRATLGAPWTKDHRIALAATVLATRASELQ